MVFPLFPICPLFWAARLARAAGWLEHLGCELEGWAGPNGWPSKEEEEEKEETSLKNKAKLGNRGKRGNINIKRCKKGKSEKRCFYNG